jgi:hypothetical protein
MFSKTARGVTLLRRRMTLDEMGRSTRYRRLVACSILSIAKVESVGFP